VVHERYRRQTTDDRQTDDRQTDDRQTDGRRHIANMNMSSRSLKMIADAIKYILNIVIGLYMYTVINTINTLQTTTENFFFQTLVDERRCSVSAILTCQNGRTLTVQNIGFLFDRRCVFCKSENGPVDLQDSNNLSASYRHTVQQQ